MEDPAGAAEGLGRGKPSSARDWRLGLAPEWEELLASTLQIGLVTLGARTCTLFLFDESRPGTRRLVLARVLGGGADQGVASQEAPEGGLAWQAAEAGVVAAVRPEPEWLCQPGGTQERSLAGACAPVRLAETPLGVLCAVRGATSRAFGASDLRLLEDLARQVALCLHTGSLFQHATRLANTDGLTGVHNCRYFSQRLDTEVERAKRYGRSVSLIMLDLDALKRYNDLYGHQQGDLALRWTAATTRRAVRRMDIVARYGGDEFAVILPETTCEQALPIAERVAHAMRGHRIPAPDGRRSSRLSASMGVSSYPALAKTKDELVQQADEALYHAKKSRSQAISAWEPGSSLGVDLPASLPSAPAS